MVVSSHWRHLNQLKSISFTVVNRSQWFLRDIQKHNEMITNAKNESRDECIRLDLLVLRFLINVDTCPFSPLQVLGDMLLWQGWKGSKDVETPRSDNCDNCEQLELVHWRQILAVSAVCGSWSVSLIHSSQESVRWEGGRMELQQAPFHWDWGSLPISFPSLFRRWSNPTQSVNSQLGPANCMCYSSVQRRPSTHPAWENRSFKQPCQKKASHLCTNVFELYLLASDMGRSKTNSVFYADTKPWSTRGLYSYPRLSSLHWLAESRANWSSAWRAWSSG